MKYESMLSKLDTRSQNLNQFDPKYRSFKFRLNFKNESIQRTHQYIKENILTNNFIMPDTVW